MKVDNFRSFNKNLSWAKAKHISLGYHGTQQLDLEAKRATRSVNRGSGVVRQSAEFHMIAAAASWTQIGSHTDGLLVYSEPTVGLVSLWILREKEVAWAAIGHMTIDFTTQLDEWTLRCPRQTRDQRQTVGLSLPFYEP